MSPGEITRIMAVLKGAYPRQGLPKETIEAYSMFLSDMDFEDARIAVIRHVRTSEFFPSIAELRRACAQNAQEPITAAEAWSLVLAAAAARGRLREPLWPSGAISRSVQALGWAAICNADERELGIMRAHFLRLYGELVEVEERRAMLSQPEPENLIESANDKEAREHLLKTKDALVARLSMKRLG